MGFSRSSTTRRATFARTSKYFYRKNDFLNPRLFVITTSVSASAYLTFESTSSFPSKSIMLSRLFSDTKLIRCYEFASISIDVVAL